MHSDAVAIKGDEVYNFGLPVGSSLSSPSPYSSSTPIPIPTANQQWRVPSWHGDTTDDFVNSFKQRAGYRPPPLQRSYSFSVGSFDEFAFSAPSTGCGSTFSESDFPSPHELPPTPESMPCNEPVVGSNLELFTYGQDSVQQVSAPFSTDVSQSLTMGGDLAFNFPMDSLDGHCMSVCSVGASVPSVMASMSAGFIDSMSLAPAPAVLSSSVTSDDNGFNYYGSVPATVSPAMLSNLSPRVSQLIDYYDKAICPILVAVDGPKNPYRMHILTLAQTCSPALTNAVAALSANVLHQRTAASVNPPGYSMSPLSLSQPRGASDESLQFKAQAVALFNAAAHDPAAAHDDAMLATLVVLSLFGISESGGVAKLNSQLPEVRQIVAMRGGNGSLTGSVGGSVFLHWAAAFFAWLDVMTATVTDKETQMRTPCLDLLDFSASLGALDHLAFSEGRMLKVVARMAAAAPQAHQQQQAHLPHHPHPHRPHHAHSSSFGGVASVRQATDTRRPSINPFTGLPLASPPPQATTFAAAVAASAEMTASLDSVIVNGTASGNPADARQEFWSEWTGVRARLRRMSREASAAAASSAAGAPGSTTPGVFPASPAMRPGMAPVVGGAPSAARSEAEAEQVTHAAEAFRQAAALFAERAAGPAAAAMSPPSTTSASPASGGAGAHGVQQLVAAVMHHVSRVPAASPLHRIMAWPLLVAGSDAARPAHRDLVRLRAPEALREPGFCGAASALDVLERVWAADDGVVMAPPAWDVPTTQGWQGPRVSSLGAAAGKWTSAMVGMQMELGLM